MVDDDVYENSRAGRMRGGREFAELFNAGRAFVELDKRGVNGGQVERGVGAAAAPEARVGRGRGMHGQQMDYFATELVDDVRELRGEVAEFS